MTLTDDDLGARLRSALQTVTPLATDPVPPPRFASAGAAHPDDPAFDAAFDPDGPAGSQRADVVEIGAGPRPRPRRRLAVAAGVLVAAAVTVGVVVATTDVAVGPADTSAPAAPSGPVVAPTAITTVPDRDGAYLGVTPDPAPWRCTAPAGTTLAASLDRDQFSPAVWTVAPGVTCAPFPAEIGRFTFSNDGRDAAFGTAEQQEATGGGGRYCLYVATRTSRSDPSFTSRGDADYLEFYGPACRLRLPAR